MDFDEEEKQSAADRAALTTHSSEIPFLVTHWLANYTKKTDNTDALRRINKAAAELASAFSELGVFGTVAREPLSSEGNTVDHLEKQKTNATFADMKRQWSNCPSSQLEHVLDSAVAATNVLDSTVASLRRPLNLMIASTETVLDQKRNPTSGRTLHDAIEVDEVGVQLERDKLGSPAKALSFLHRPIQFSACNKKERISIKTDSDVCVSLVSTIDQLSRDSGDKQRLFLDMRDEIRLHEDQIRGLKRSLEIQNRKKEQFEQEAALGGLDMAALDENAIGQANCERVIAQVQRQLDILEKTVTKKREEIQQAKAAADNAHRCFSSFRARFRDPLHFPGMCSAISKNVVLNNLRMQQSGLDTYGGKCLSLGVRGGTNDVKVSESRKSIICARFSVAATINTHLSYPVYCLRFDRTGRYFITGADDYLVKVFRVSEGSIARRNLDPASLQRGAILVFTLRGHAGVINDIDVSSDNAMLATASEDGDCRVWGLKDGYPIAILRGHTGGANMVSWSKLTPYRLVTTGADGLARIWDVRKACLKRYGSVVGKRPEYAQHKHARRNEGTQFTDNRIPDYLVNEVVPEFALNEMPDRANSATSQHDEAAIPLPPLPPAAGLELPDGDEIAGQNDAVEPGAFVSNDHLDDGVAIVAKLQHGAVLDDSLSGPNTRSRRAKVKVICLARNPLGGFFATGSDDGIGRIWRDEDDPIVEQYDSFGQQIAMLAKTDFRALQGKGVVSTERLIDTLKGHLSAITDLQFSHDGDRLLTASQKDGVVRIWSWKVDPRFVRKSSPAQHTHILIKLTNPLKMGVAKVDSSRRRPTSRSSEGNISCDAAVWFQDDAKIATSQCELLKQSSTEIASGSQYIFVWDSLTGDCLLGFSSAHTMQCPVLIPHPTDAGLLCSAGADGIVKLWDCYSGECKFTFKNTVTFGPIEPVERGKASGFLDGSFSPDGTALVLTDDSGRVSVVDSRSVAKMESFDVPSWMKEQYFASDYYELYYDVNGYCIERGSEQPPHLAPRAARCSHSGSSWSDGVNECLKKLVGPMPISVRDARWNRQQTRNLGKYLRLNAQGADSCNIVAQCDTLKAVLIGADGKGRPSVQGHAPEPEQRQNDLAAHSNRTSRTLSTNYRWSDYYDVAEDEGNEVEDPDDEEFQLQENPRVPGNSSDHGSDSELEADFSVEADDASERRLPVSRRQRYIDGEESDDSEHIEYLSTNNEPSGPFISDYENHFFRLPGAAAAKRVKRLWVRRDESTSSYAGRKSYTPQVMDSVVYIPEAHYNSLVEFPGVVPPWQHWPEGVAWPVVKCIIRSIRYRFPYKAYFKKDLCSSVVAILVLEITGIPELSHDRNFGWPKPSFTSPARAHFFEVAMFQNDKPDFIIPATLYEARLSQLETWFQQTSGVEKLNVYLAAEDGEEDSSLTPYAAQLVSLHLDNAGGSLPQISGSGFETVEVRWEDGNNGYFSPWEVGVPVAVEPPHPSLSNEEKRTVQDGINALLDIKDVRNTFQYPVDETVYSDYATRVEVPMDICFIAKRLQSGYYCSKQSAVFDVHLIRENSVKYNGVASEVSILAATMVNTFESIVLSPEEREVMQRHALPLSVEIQVVTQQESIVVMSGEEAKDRKADAPSGQNNTPTVRMSLRRGARRRRDAGESRNSRSMRMNTTVLESMSPPVRNVTNDIRERAQRNRGRRNAREEITLTSQQNTQNGQTLESLSMNGRGVARGRGRNHANQGRDIVGSLRPRIAPSSARPHPVSNILETANRRVSQRITRASELGNHQAQRRSTRFGSEAVNYREAPSDVDDRHNDESISRRRSGRLQNDGERTEASRTIRGRSQAILSETTEDEDSENEPTQVKPKQKKESRQRLDKEESSFSSGAKESSDSESDALDSEVLAYSSGSDPSNSVVSFEHKVTRRARPARKRAMRSSSNSGRNKGYASEKRKNEKRRTIESSESEDDLASEKFQKRTRTTRSSGAKAYHDETAAEDEPSSDSSGSGSGEEEIKGTRRSTAAVSRRSPRRSRANQKSYVEVASDDGLDLENDEIRGSSRRTKAKQSSEETVAATSRHSTRKREPVRQSYSEPSAEPALKRRRNTSTSEDSPHHSVSKSASKAHPALHHKKMPWPDINMKKITLVIKTVLEAMEELDVEHYFAEPVVESYPELEKEYSKLIPHPMDFRTIKEDRLMKYRSIQEFQDDLSLIFQNALTFNERNSEVAGMARVLLSQMDDVFRMACKSARATLPPDF